MKKNLTARQIRDFRNTIWEYYRNYGRRHLPWRKTKNVYRILVSEVMLQQTQVERVIPKYKQFLKRFPTVAVLAHAPLAEVVAVWQGLGYNRRAVLLKKSAGILLREYDERVPDSTETLKTLPGIGLATASAVTVFAFNRPLSFIETNIRTVYIHSFFPGRKKVHDDEILPLVERTLDATNPREWFYALMDYGVFLKKNLRIRNNRSVHYFKQSPFEGSVRQLRGTIVRLLSQNGGMSKGKIEKQIPKNNHEIDMVLEQLQRDGLVRKKGRTFVIG